MFWVPTTRFPSDLFANVNICPKAGLVLWLLMISLSTLFSYMFHARGHLWQSAMRLSSLEAVICDGILRLENQLTISSRGMTYSYACHDTVPPFLSTHHLTSWFLWLFSRHLATPPWISPAFRCLPVAPVASTSPQQATARLKETVERDCQDTARSFLRIERATKGLAMPRVDPAVRRILGPRYSESPWPSSGKAQMGWECWKCWEC